VKLAINFPKGLKEDLSRLKWSTKLSFDRNKEPKWLTSLPSVSSSLC